MPLAQTAHLSPSGDGSLAYVVTGIAVHAVGEEEFCWVYLASNDGSNGYVELSGDDESYPSKDAALIAAYLAFRKGTRLLGVRAVVARSFERIHRSNLAGLGVLPMQFIGEDSVQSLGLDGSESFDLLGIEAGVKPLQTVQLAIHRSDGTTTTVNLLARIDTQIEAEYFRQGGVLPYVLDSQLASQGAAARQPATAQA